MQHTVTKFIKIHQLLTRDATVLIGVSGGPDSMALLHYYQSIRAEWNLNLVAVSVDHQLRGAESEEDLHYVKEICEKWSIKFVGASVDVELYKEDHKVGTQVAAREMRYHIFAEQMKKHQADFLSLGHHSDDQLETMLMGFVRSASPIALSGIPAKRIFSTGHIVRPFLCVTKADIIAYCGENKIKPRIDPSNEDTEYTRNYFRKYIIPIIKVKNSNIHTTVQRLSESLQEDERFLQDEAAEMVRKVVNLDNKSKQATFKINIFKSYPHSLQRRGYHLILNYMYNELPGNLSYVHEDIFFTLLGDNHGNTQVDFPHNLKVEKSYEKCAFFFLDPKLQNPSFREALNIPGKLNFPDGSKLTAVFTGEPIEKDEYTWICDTKSVALPLHIRTRQPGDRMSWKGLEGSKKIKDVFIDAKIPRKTRDIWPIVTDNHGEILWLIGLRKGNRTQTKESSYIQLTYEGGD